MATVLQEAISAYNLPLTLLLGLIGLYWLTSLIGLMDFDALDGVLGLDSDGGGDAGGVEAQSSDSAHGNGDEGGHEKGDDEGHGHGFMGTLMHVLGATDAPVMFVITLFSLLLWGANMLGNIYLNDMRSGTFATGILGASLAGAFVLTRVLVRPLRPLMRLLRDTEKRAPIEGLTGTVRSLSVGESEGQVEVLRDGAPILLHARISPGREPLPRGMEVLVVAEIETGKGIYTVRPLDKTPPNQIPPKG